MALLLKESKAEMQKAEAEGEEKLAQTKKKVKDNQKQRKRKGKNVGGRKAGRMPGEGADHRCAPSTQGDVIKLVRNAPHALTCRCFQQLSFG